MDLDDALKKDYERLKELLGKKEGEKYIEENRGCGRNIFMKLLYLELVAYSRKKPLLFTIYLIAFIFFVGLMLYRYFTY